MRNSIVRSVTFKQTAAFSYRNTLDLSMKSHVSFVENSAKKRKN